MRKLFLVVCIALLVAACETKFYTVLISNGSSKTVSYTYNDTFDTLAPSTSKTYYDVKAYTQPPKNYADQDGNESIKIKYNSMTGDYTFIDKDS